MNGKTQNAPKRSKVIGSCGLLQESETPVLAVTTGS
jgi:hypothetical protein